MAFEELCRKRLPLMKATLALSRLGPWGPASRWWHGEMPEWDIISESIDGHQLLLGEARWAARALGLATLERTAKELSRKTPPTLPETYKDHAVVRVLFVPDVVERPKGRLHGVLVVTCADLLP